MTVTERNSSRRGTPDEPTGWSKGLEVTTGGTAVVSHAGPVLLRRLVDKTGLTAGLSKALATQRLLVHDRGRVTVDLACAIADGAEVISDFRILADQRELSGLVASVPTAWRTLSEIASGGPRAQARISGAVNAARRQAWASIEARHGAIPGVRVAGKVVLDAAIAAVPAEHRGRLMVTYDGAGASHGLIEHLDELARRRGHQLVYSAGWQLGGRERRALARVPGGAWQAAVDGRGRVRERRAADDCPDPGCGHAR